MPSQILKILRNGLAEVLDGVDAEVIMAALRKAGFDDALAAQLTADLVPDKPNTPRRRTRAAAAAADDDDPELMAAAMREALEEMAGEQDGTSAQMLQLIRENLEEALTGEYAEESREALRKAGVEDALGVFEDPVSLNLGDLIDDDDGVDTASSLPVSFTHRDIPRVRSSSWPTSWRRPPTRPSRSSTPRRAAPARAAWARRRASFSWRRRPRRPSRCPRRPARPSSLAAPGRACAGYRRGLPKRLSPTACRVDFHAIGATSRRSNEAPRHREHGIASTPTRDAQARRDGDQARTLRARGFGNLSFAFFAGLAAGFFAPAGLGDLGVFGLGFDGFVPPTHSPLS